MPVIIAIANEKGGVGKTTTTVSLGGAYALAGRRTLLIDLDPQASLTRGLIGSVWTDRLPVEATVAALFGDQVVPLERLVRETGFAGLALLPGSRRLRELNRLEPGEYGMGQFALRDLDLSGFERVLIDLPPNLEFCSWCAMAAADWVLIPLQPEDYGAQGVQFVLRAAATVQASVNPRLQVLGLLRTMHQKRAAVHAAVSERLGHEFPGLLMAGSIPHAAQFREAVMARTPIGFYKPRGAAAKACAAVVEEMEVRVKSGARREAI